MFKKDILIDLKKQNIIDSNTEYQSVSKFVALSSATQCTCI